MHLLTPYQKVKQQHQIHYAVYLFIKNPVEVTKETPEGLETFVEGDKIVASWCGRYDDINKTHEQLQLIIEWYNAWTLVENNISLFIQYMIAKEKTKVLSTKGTNCILERS